MERDIFFLHTPFGMVRDAIPADTGGLIQMVVKLAAHHNESAVLTSHNLVRDAFEKRPWIYVLVAEIDNELVGYAALCGLIQLQFGTRGLDMHHLFTEARFRRRGVGHALIEACKIKAKALSCSYMTVTTHPDNHKAQAFYEANGFVRKDSCPSRFSMQLAE